MVLVEEASVKNTDELTARSMQDKKVVLSAGDSMNLKPGDKAEVILESLVGDTFRVKVMQNEEQKAVAC